MLKSSDQEFKTTTINILRIHMEKVDNIHEKVGNKEFYINNNNTCK